ncbi:MAG TPA: glycosyltransferase family A protein, partial [Actinomycetota bacterium]|nr:glycosyltransferase family A protein [Actinomycetota bacterium]
KRRETTGSDDEASPNVRVTVIMPTYDQDSFLPAAVASLIAQSEPNWELVVVDDGSPGDTKGALGAFLDHPRIRLETFDRNRGLGAALNHGVDCANARYIAYLPSDDVFYRDHLACLCDLLDASPDAVLAVAGVRHHEVRISPGQIDGEPLQLVQVVHRRTRHRWTERSELTTDDLGRMLWTRLLEEGGSVDTGRVTCEWGWHPLQRHKALREPWGGLNTYRSRYRVQEPLRLQSTVGHLHDEVNHYRRFRERPPTPRRNDGLRVLLVGELAHNAERILVLEEGGHELYGLWTDTPVWFNTVGPVPFGHVADIPRDGWRDAVKRLRPDIIYALLNWEAIAFAHEVLVAKLGVPFIWHFKEGPFFARDHGLWRELVDLHTLSDGVIYSSPELQQWFAATVPASIDRPTLVVDGDLPKGEWLSGERSDPLSLHDGAVHTVIPGRPMGPDPEVIGVLADADIHVHLYSEKAASQMRAWVDEVKQVAPGYFHVHPQVDQADWVREFSKYDAGWLHSFRSDNQGDPYAATWDDLNYPARMGTLAAAGVPMIQRDNRNSMVATQNLARERGLGLFWRDSDDLVTQLRDSQRMGALRENVWRQRSHFTFDAHVDRLVEFFRKVIAEHQ